MATAVAPLETISFPPPRAAASQGAGDLQSAIRFSITSHNLNAFMDGLEFLPVNERFAEVLNAHNENNFFHRMISDIRHQHEGNEFLEDAIPRLLKCMDIPNRKNFLELPNGYGENLLGLIIELNNPALTFNVFCLVGGDEFVKSMGETLDNNLAMKLGLQLFQSVSIIVGPHCTNTNLLKMVKGKGMIPENPTPQKALPQSQGIHLVPKPN